MDKSIDEDRDWFAEQSPRFQEKLTMAAQESAALMSTTVTYALDRLIEVVRKYAEVTGGTVH